MMRPKLTLDDLASGLMQFAETYFALDVFASDVEELTDPAKAQAAGLKSAPDDSFIFERQGRRFSVRVFPDLGVARVRFADAASNSLAPVVLSGAGALLGAASSKRGSEMGGAAIGFLAGLLVGAAIGAPAANPPRRVFVLRFDPEAQEWRPYDGGLVRWVKEQLAAPEVVGDLPPHAQRI